MSGSWQERAEAGGPLKPGDLAAALRDVSAAQRAVTAALGAADERGAVAKRLEAVEAKLADVLARLDAPKPPSKATPPGRQSS